MTRVMRHDVAAACVTDAPCRFGGSESLCLAGVGSLQSLVLAKARVQRRRTRVWLAPSCMLQCMGRHRQREGGIEREGVRGRERRSSGLMVEGVQRHKIRAGGTLQLSRLAGLCRRR